MLTDGLVSYWKFDEGTGSTVSDSVGGNTGTWSGTLGNQWATGIIKSAGHFNGSNNFVDIGTTSSLNITSSITLSVWFNADVNDGFFRTMLSRSTNAGGGGTKQWGIGFGSNNKLYTSVVIGGVEKAINTTSYTPNAWHNYLLSWNGVTSLEYLDGVQTGTISAVGTINSASLPAEIGIQRNPSNVAAEFFKGNIDEVGIWNRALSATEVSLLYNGRQGLQFPFQNTASGTLFVPIQSLQTTFNTTSEGVISNINARDILLRSTVDCYVDFNQPVAPTTSFLLSGSNTEDTEIQVPNGTINNLYFQGATQAGSLYVVVKY